MADVEGRLKAVEDDVQDLKDWRDETEPRLAALERIAGVLQADLANAKDGVERVERQAGAGFAQVRQSVEQLATKALESLPKWAVEKFDRRADELATQRMWNGALIGAVVVSLIGLITFIATHH